jgi:DHA3 family tetracycline resistance protein-like MFS transporter
MRRPDQYTVYIWMRAAAAFAFSIIITYELVYHTVTIGLTPFQLVMVGVVLESMTLFFEIPTGVIADVYSRRLSVITGLFLTGAGFLLEGLWPAFSAVLFAQVLWGIGFTFYSGAAEAWITDEIGEERAAGAFLRGAQVSQIAALAGITVSSALANITIGTSIVVGALLYFIIVLFLLATMSEAGFKPASKDSGPTFWEKIIVPVRQETKLLRSHPTLQTILLLGFVIGLYVGGFDRLYAPHLVQDFVLPKLGALDSVTWFGILSGLIGLGSLLGLELVRRRLDLARQTNIVSLLLVIYSAMITCTLIFALTDKIILALVVFCLSQTLRQISRPILMVWINQNADSQARATIISSYWQSNALGQIVGSPIIGWIGTVVSVRMALTAGATVYSLSLPLLGHARRYRVKPVVRTME